MSVVEGYIKALKNGEYEKALSMFSEIDRIPMFGGKSLIRETIERDPNDNPDLVRRLVELGADRSFCDNNSVLYASFYKPNTLKCILGEYGVIPTRYIIGVACEHFRIAAVIFIESAKMFLPPKIDAYANLISALSHAKRATYALLKSYKLLGKDVTRIIAKLVWGSRANINWE